ncbi:MAG: 30S ribosomal protein S10 [Spirochaetae bacterium HGW-Spirochaetae-6]|jgi:small subunit ribosomal protein S10|nr:MAG: 30S ribosomal protein S10 [Spirochaetae bacterium HGW-Spirochaetae-6]
MIGNRIRIRLKSFDHELIEGSINNILEALSRVSAKTSGPVPLPTKIKKYTVLRSPHVNKKSREQFEIRVHKRLIDILEPDEKTIDVLKELKLPTGVEVEIK